MPAALPVPGMPSTSPVGHRQIPPRNRRRRSRTIYTTEQLASMEAVFATNQYPDINSRETLADAIDLTEARVQVRLHSIHRFPLFCFEDLCKNQNVPPESSYYSI